MMLVTLAEAKAQMYVDHNADDALITNMILGASESILNYLEGAEIRWPERDSVGAIVLDSQGDPVYKTGSSGYLIAPPVKTACLIYVAELYKNREAIQDGEVNSLFGYGYLPRPVTALLFNYRKFPIV